MNALSFVFINGQFAEHLSDKNLLSHGVDFRVDEGGAVLQVADHYHAATPIHLKFISDSDRNVQLSRRVVLGRNSKLAVIEEYTGAEGAKGYSFHSRLEVELNDYATMDYFKLQNENITASHHAAILVEQKESSTLNLFFADCGGQKSHADLQVRLHEPYAVCHMHGLYFLNHDDQEVNNVINVQHLAEHGTSSMIFKGVLDKKSRALFNGKVHVHDKAQHTNAHQANHNLLLSANAEVTAQPQLEIYAEDIKCSHGATVGQLDADSLFYLRARGIEKPAALKMLTDAFIAEIMNKIESSVIREYFYSRVSQHE